MNTRGATSWCYVQPQERSHPSGGGRLPATEFKWVCPYCRESKVEQYAVADGEGDALAALRSHIGAAAGDGHGPRDEMPEDTERTLFGYVCCVDERR